MWSAMMIVLSYSYSNFIYSVLMSPVKPNLPTNPPDVLKLDEIKVYTFQHPQDQYPMFTTRVDDLIERVELFTGMGKKIVETVEGVGDYAAFDKIAHSLAYHGFVDSKRIVPQFIALQNYGDLTYGN